MRHEPRLFPPSGRARVGWLTPAAGLWEPSFEARLTQTWNNEQSPGRSCDLPGLFQWRGEDLNLRPSGYEPSGFRIFPSALGCISPARSIVYRSLPLLSLAPVGSRRRPSCSRCVRAERAIRLRLLSLRLVPLGGDQPLTAAPVVDDGVLKPILRQVGVVADDDLEVRREVGDGIKE